MSYATWADFVYYNLDDTVAYQGTTYKALQANINVVPTTLAPNWELVVVGVVDSLSGGTGALTQSCINGTYTLSSNNIELAITYPTPPTATWGSFFGTTTQTLTPLVTLIVAFNQARSGSSIFPLGSYPATRFIIPTSGNYRISFYCRMGYGAGNNGVSAFLLVGGVEQPLTGFFTFKKNREAQLYGMVQQPFVSGDNIGIGLYTIDSGNQIRYAPVAIPSNPVSNPSVMLNIVYLG